MNIMELVAKLSLDDTEYVVGLDKAAKRGSTFGGAMKKLGKIAGVAWTAATTAVTGFAASSVKTGMNFDQAMSQVAATMGKTMADMESEVGEVDLAWGKFSGNLRDYAQEMGAHTVFSASQAAEALNYMALAGYDTQKSMEMLPNVLNLAAAGAMDLGKASDMVTDISSALTLNQGETNELVDKLAMGASKANASVEQLGSAMLRVGGTAKFMKGGTTELTAALGILADNGTKGAEGGTALRNILTGIQNKKFEKTFGALGVSAYDSEGNMRNLKDVFIDMNKVMEGMNPEEKSKLIMSAFNARSLKDINAFLNTAPERWDELTGAIEESEGAAQKMADTQLDNLAGDVTLFKSALEGAQIALSDGMSPALRKFVQAGSDGLSEFTEKLKDGDYAGAAQTIGATLGEELRLAISKLPSLASAGTALLQGLFQGVLGGIAAENENVAELFTDSLKVKLVAKASSFVDSGAQMLGNLMDGIGSVGPRLIELAGALIKSLATSLGQNAPMLISKGIEMIGNLLIGIAMALPDIIIGGINLVTGLIEGIGSGSGDLVEKFFEIITSLGGAIYAAMPEILSALWELLKSLVKAVGSTNFLSVALRAFRGILSGLQRVVPLVINAAKNLVVRVLTYFGFTGLAQKASAAFDSAKQKVQEKLEAIKNKVSDMISSIKSKFPFSIGKIFSGWAPKISASVNKNANGGGSMSIREEKYGFAKAMNQPYLFNRRQVFYESGEAGEEILMGRQALRNDLADAVKGAGGDINIYLNYQAGDDANDMLKDIARGVQRYKMAGVI